jgi:ABC-type lipoprotein release transport system permease subunit
MNMLPKLAWKNLWRRKRRTLITMSSIAFGVWFAGTFLGVRNHSHTSLIEGSVRLGLGHVAVEASGHHVAPGFEKKLFDASSIVAAARETSGVSAAIPRIIGPAMFATAAGSSPGVVLGVDPAQESGALNVYVGAIDRGRLFDARDGRGAVIGDVMAERLNIELGNKLIYTVVGADGEMISETARVEGIFHTGVADADGATVLLPIDTLRGTLKYREDEVTVVSIYLDDHEDAPAIAAALRAHKWGGAELFTWRETQPGVAGYIALARHRTDVFLSLIVLVIATGVLNTMLMSVIERKRELGVMLAVGASPRRLFGLIVCEATFLSLLGFAVGIVLFIPWMIYMRDVGIDLTRIIGADMEISGVLYDPVLRIALRSRDAIAVFAALFMLALATALYPARRAARLPPIESMKSA